jgi:hypothetical protein
MSDFDKITSDLSRMWARIRQDFAHRREAERFSAPGRFAPRHDRNRAIHDAAHIREKIGRGDRAELWICYSPIREEVLEARAAGIELSSYLNPDALNGYIAFTKRHAPALPRNDTGNIVQYIPVHGGVTYALKDGFAAVWGFDTHHHRSETVDRTDADYIRYQCALLYHGLEVAEDLWPRFHRERDMGKRAEIVQALFNVDPARSGEPVTDRLGFQGLLGLLGNVG